MSALESGSRKLWKINIDRHLLDPLTFQELAALRAYFDERRYHRQMQVERREGRTSGFTCDVCNVKARCPFVYDIYNVRGKCLAETGKRIAEENDPDLRRRPKPTTDVEKKTEEKEKR